MRVGIGIGSSWKEAEDNARLFAAAPDLLDALRDLSARFEAIFAVYVAPTYVGSNGKSDLDLTLATARLAIAKATGEGIERYGRF